MAHIGVPWFIGGANVEHSAQVARLLAYNASGGREGIVGPLDCRCLALATPGQGIRVTPGGYNILTQTLPYQMYSGLILSDDIVQTTPTSSSGGRTDLVILRVENPNVSGEQWDQPPDIASGPYAFTRIIEGVPPGTMSWEQLGFLDSAVAVARIDIPASTATITQAMITDLRGKVGSTAGNPVVSTPVGSAPVPESSQFVSSINCTSNSLLNPPPAGSGFRTSSWVTWPTEAQWSVPVPTWATKMVVYYTVNPGINANTWGQLRLNFNGRYSAVGAFDVNFPLQSTGNAVGTFTNGGGMRTNYVLGDTMVINANERGKTVSVKVEGQTFDDSSYPARGVAGSSRGTVSYLQLTFIQGHTSS